MCGGVEAEGPGLEEMDTCPLQVCPHLWTHLVPAPAGLLIVRKSRLERRGLGPQSLSEGQARLELSAPSLTGAGAVIGKHSGWGREDQP